MLVCVKKYILIANGLEVLAFALLVRNYNAKTLISSNKLRRSFLDL